MEDDNTDIITCKGFQYDCELGFHDYEQGIKQRVTIDLEVRVRALSADENNNPDAIQFDYFKANLSLLKLLDNNKYNLIESLAEDVAQKLLKEFRLKQIKVSVTKKPLKLMNVECVTYTCVRKNETY